MLRSVLYITAFITSCFASAAVASQVANPAAAYCIEQGGAYSTEDTDEGQRGLCTLADGSVVDAWAHFREQHSAAPSGSTQLANPAAVYCIEQGGTYSIENTDEGQRGWCTLSDGTVVDAWEYFREQHALATEPNGPVIADRIWTGGPILTMDDKQMRAEALAEKDGVIVGVGKADDIMKLRGPSTEMIDLAGRAMIPGLVDAHGHVFMTGIQALSANLLPAPDGEVNDIPTLQRVLRDFADAQPERVAAAGLILGFGYDDAQLAELRHPTRDELDAVSSDIAVYVMHQSGHFGVANTKALELGGITADTPDPAGGVIRRREGSNEPNGVLEENATAPVLAALLSGLDVEANRAIFLAGTELYASFGYTTAQEGRSVPAVSRLMQSVATEDGLDIDVVTYPDVLVDRDYILENQSRTYTDRFRVGGAKLTIDGSPQGFTALRDRPYYNPPEGFRADYAGYASATGDQVFDAVDWAFENGVQILVHSNGEGASDILIGAVDTATQAHGEADRRPVLIHGQFLREDQVDAFNSLDVFPSLFPMHTFYWGDWHRDRTVGPAAADNISPTGWVRDRGMMFSSHHDAPVAFPDSMRILDATVTRRSRSNDIIGPAHRVDVITALKAMTIWPAYQHFEEDRKGSLEKGKLADLVILSNDPTAIDPETLDSITVVETIKEGETVYAANAQEGFLNYRPRKDGTDPYADFLRLVAVTQDMQGSPGALGRLSPSIMARAPHSGACEARTLGDLITASVVTADLGEQIIK
ncbi:amidohydrolase family protein [Tateyamaria sp. Alg231-49]|uniref:amidohydrolase family protein n=1 Tax=Tateyamaria sp. Alg231-49 TaxID=1922219 RepID=UPI00131F38C2|nr:amidohydrolase family protein [Tateyamaria sp. Alg231-49]